jgi:hypothetical protein
MKTLFGCSLGHAVDEASALPRPYKRQSSVRRGGCHQSKLTDVSLRHEDMSLEREHARATVSASAGLLALLQRYHPDHDPCNGGIG